jgi:hypothetical protein
MKDYQHISEEGLINLLHQRDVRIKQLEAAIRDAVFDLEKKAGQADGAHQRQEEAFEKWLKTRKGGKPAPAVALPVAAAEMRNVALRLRAAFLKKDEQP